MEPPELQEGQESFELGVEALPDSVHVVTALEELIQNKFKLKTSVYRENDFVALYSACIQRALASVEPISFDELLNKRDKHYICDMIFNKNDYRRHYGILRSIFIISIGIIKVNTEYYLLIPKSWGHLVVCNPTKNYSIVGWAQHILEYFYKHYPNQDAVFYHYI